METQSVSFPKMTIRVNLVGDNSLVGALAVKIIEKDYMKHIGVLRPDEILFIIKQVHKGVNLYEELNRVKDVYKIDEKKIALLLE